MDEECKETSYNLSTTLSSEPISFPSGQKLDNISSVTEISDSELETKKPHSDEEFLTSQVTNKDINPPKANDIHDSTQCNVPVQVRNTLQANANLLSDKNILRDLLHPENANYTNNLLNMQKKFGSLVSQFTQDNAQKSEHKQGSLYTNSSMLRPNYSHSETSINKVLNQSQTDHISKAPYLSVSSTPKKLYSSQADLPSASEMVKHQKRVNFKSGDGLCKEWRNENQVYYTELHNHPKNLSSFLSYGPEKVFDKLGEIRNHLEVKVQDAEEEEGSASDLPLSRLLVAKLNSQKQRTKDLEEELTLNEASLAKATCELEVVQKRLFRREEQLKEAGDQIGRLQAEWQGIQRKLVASREKYQLENEQMKKVIDFLKNEKENLEKELKNLREESKELISLKANSAGMKLMVESSSKRSEEIREENQRLNKALLQYEQTTNNFDKEKKILEQKVEGLHCKLDSLTLANNSLNEEMRLLKERHSALLRKTVDETELKEKATREKARLEESVEAMKVERRTLLRDLNLYYQDELETILGAKMKAIKEEFEGRQKRFQDDFDAQTRTLSATYDAKVKELCRRHAEEVESLRTKFKHDSEKQVRELKETRRENALLRSQREAIVSALSSAAPLASKEPKPDLRVYLDKEMSRAESSASSVENQKKYSFTQFGGLESYSVGNQKDPSRESVRSNQPSKESSSQNKSRREFRDLPLITSTSISSLSAESDSSSEGRITVRERKTTQREKKKGVPVPRARTFPWKLLTAAQILGTTESSLSASEGGLNPEALKEVDMEMADLVQEINSLSEIMVPHSNQDTPRHDTSLEQDSARQALRRIDLMSDLLANTWKGLDERDGKT